MSDDGPITPRGPVNGLSSPRFSGIATFARLPHTRETAGVDIAVVGAPFDTGTSFRTGQRFGPRAIRDASALLRPWHPHHGVDVYSEGAIDWGDISISPGDSERSTEQLATGLVEVMSCGITPVVLGGDHTILLGELRASAAVYGPVGVVIIDAHADVWDEYFGQPIFHGTIVKRAVDEGIVDPSRSIIAGLRGPLYDAADERRATDLGFMTMSIEELRAIEPAAFGDVVRERTAGGITFLSFDIDVLDPAFAPGTGVPEIGGLTPWEAQAHLRALTGIGFCGFDVVEVLPASDGPGAVTALNAAGMAWELMALDALWRSEQEPPVPVTRVVDAAVTTPVAEGEPA